MQGAGVGVFAGAAVLVLLLAGAGCGDDGGPPASEDASALRDTGAPVDGGGGDASGDAAATNRCAAPEIQHPPCCWEVSNAEREVLELAARGVAFVEPAALANEVFRAVLQEGLDSSDAGENDVMLLVRATPAGTGYRVQAGFGCHASRGAPWRFATEAGVCGAPDGSWAPVEAMGTIDGDLVTTEPAGGTLVIPLPQAGTPPPELRIRTVRIAQARLTDGRSCIGSRLASGRWIYGEPPSRIEGFIALEDARATTIPSLEGQSFCQVIAGAPCDQPREVWPVAPDARCDGDTCAPRCDDEACAADRCDPVSDDPARGCNAWRLLVAAAAAGVEIE